MSKKKKKKQKEFDGIFINLKNDFYKQGLSEESISRLKYNLLKYNKTNYWNFLLHNNSLKNFLDNRINNLSLENLGSGLLLNFSDNTDELIWCFYHLKMFSDEINLFIKYRDKFDKYYLSGEYENAIKTLDEIQISFGYSLWLIENKINLLQLYYGFEEQKKYEKFIMDNAQDPLIRVFTSFYSLRAEDNVSSVRYTYRFNEFINEFQDESFKEYLTFRLHYYYHTQKYHNFAYILGYEFNQSLIDTIPS